VQVGEDWSLTVRSQRFAQWVALDVPGFAPEDSWFHVAPNSEHTVALKRLDSSATPKGRVRALNGLYSTPVVLGQ
jgi:beta-mannosidase